LELGIDDLLRFQDLILPFDELEFPLDDFSWKENPVIFVLRARGEGVSETGMWAYACGVARCREGL